MALLALGLNHRTAPVSIRERVSLSGERLQQALATLRSVSDVSEAAIVSTCNRTELYCGMQAADPSPVEHWLRHTLPVDGLDVTPYLYRHRERDVVRHLMRVCSGLDSLVLGEPQILGQMKNAYRHAAENGTLGRELTPLFESAFSAAKAVRTDTDIGTSAVSVAFAAVTLARQIYSELGEQRALLIGAGDTIHLAARHLRSAGIGGITVANRTLTRAESLASEIGGQAIVLEELHEHLASADIIISSTGSPLPIIGKGAVQKALKQRRYRSQLMIDIAVPRDIEEEVADIDGVFLYSVDDLQSVVARGQHARQEAAVKAEEIVESRVEDFMRAQKSRGASDIVVAWRDSVASTREELLKRALRQLESGQNAQQVLERFAHQFGNRIMHTPTARLREAAEVDDQLLIDAARQLFDDN
ncbi:MAG: glutamyl-tRNA reductase [Gammaproteobacteria bacterium]|nr:MAG: glutamyl-tRNA reductase [Gammaproteobacteria bacterium]PIE38580.1 MAG: glutamyl-tRNA reductase [Gammaproteobacteria bacterium]